MNRLKKKYQQEVVPKLTKEFGYNNAFAVPSIKKIVLNMGVTDPQDTRARQKVLESLTEQFRVITGQQPVITRAKKAVANFKLRQGDPIGLMVTLRGTMMWEFLDRLISLALPRVKDFRGVSSQAFDGQGNYSLGLEEQIAFVEINFDNIDRVRSLQVNIVTSTEDDQQAKKLLELLGMPFAKPAENKGK
ncbi:MAG: 50S ribosomal protein L5 [Candidatus Pacebacteria bacterium]|nr:50S ribosomal protein L5 [Candidatus Paceibacterota bacterium]